jgi:biopolymer transport protein ExbD
LQLGIDIQGVMTINKIPIADLGALEIALKAELVKNPEIGVHLYADKEVVYSKLAEVMAAVQHAGISKLAFVTLEQ